MEFKKFRKITRLHGQEIIITEKIDGSNGLIFIGENGIVKAGSRNRWLSQEDDNFGFAKWVEENKEELKSLGSGYHYGEWWGSGINRGYGLDKRVFSLFNVKRFSHSKPSCCDVVPFLATVKSFEEAIELTKQNLKFSEAAFRYKVKFERPEGFMLYLPKPDIYLKVPLEK